VITVDDFQEVRLVAGIDAGFMENFTITKAAIVVLSFPDLTVVESVTATIPTSFPYIPGFLSFREIPAIEEALKKLTTNPDLLFCDGQGIAHPRRLGIASHLGVLIDKPTIGVAKSILVGKHEPLDIEKGSCQPLIYRGEIIGMVLRSREGVKPLYISVGHKISLPTALEYVKRCGGKYRLPEPTRLADKLASSRYQTRPS
jgi:deoxyribonuclease V